MSREAHIGQLKELKIWLLQCYLLLAET